MKIKNLVFVFLAFCISSAVFAEEKTVTNGELWKDTNGNAIQAHDTILKAGNKYYWYGMDYSHAKNVGDGNGFRAIKCYESEDLVNWTFKNNVLTNTVDDRFYSIEVFNPCVVYNKSTGMYVMWLGTSKGPLVAVSNTPYGNFHIHGTYIKESSGAILNSVFVDTDNAAYLVAYVWEDLDVDNPKLYIYRLTDDYLTIRTEWNTWGDIYQIAFDSRVLGRTQIIKHKGIYYLIFADYGTLASSPYSITSPHWYDFVSSNYTYYGVKWAYTDSLYNEWSGLNSFENTSRSYEFSSIFAVPGEDKTSYVAAFNGWTSSDLSQSTYTWQVLQWKDDEFLQMDIPYIAESSSITVDTKTGVVKGNQEDFDEKI